jgi:hypothetical protein
MAAANRPSGSRVPTYRGPVPATASARSQLPGGIWLMGCHGGAGVSTLAALDIGHDAGYRQWPKPTKAPAGLLLVARISALGLKEATAAAETCVSPRLPQDLVLLGLVAVAAAPGRPSKIARERLDLVAGWVRNVYRMPWVPEALATDKDQIPSCEALRRAVPAELHDLVRSTTRSA